MSRLLTTSALSAAFAFASFGSPAEAQNRLPASLTLPSTSHELCGLEELSRSEADAAHERLLAHRAAHGTVVQRFGGFPTVTIPIAYHIVLGTGVPAPSEEVILQQHDKMNEAYAGTGFRYVIAHIGYYVNDDWYGQVAPGTGTANNPAALEMKTELAIDPATTLNVFFTEFSSERSTLLGYGAFPTSWAEGRPEWSIINRLGTLPGGDVGSYNSGDTMVHEVGHNLNLYHTFQGGCHADSECEVAGDRVCDTPAQAGQPSTGCPGPGVDTCPTSAGNDDNENFMNYLFDQCAEVFTPGQAARAHESMAAFRPTIYNLSLGLTTVSSLVDFDETYIGYAEAETIYLFNASDEATTVSSADVPAGFTVDVATPFTIQPGESVAVEVRFDPADELVYDGEIVFSADGDTPDLFVDVAGFGRLAPSASVGPLPLVLDVDPGQTLQATFALANGGPGTLDWTAAVFAARAAAAQTEPADPAEPGETAGGPDAFGYTWVDSRDGFGPAPGFASIAGQPGTQSFALGLDETQGIFLPFPFPYYGESFTTATIVSDGRLHFDDDPSTDGNNTPIPRTRPPNGFVAPFWDNLDPSAGALYYQGTPERAVVEWNGVALAEDAAASLTFQAILYPDGRVRFAYGTLTNAGERAVVGLENLDGTAGLQMAARRAYAEEGLNVLVAPPPEFVEAAEPVAGTLAPEAEREVTLTVTVPENLLPGTYLERIVVASNDPARPELSVPVVLQVNPAGAPAVPEPVSPAYGAGEVASPATLAWTSAAGAASYAVEVALDERFDEVVFEADGIGATSAETDALGIGRYFWRVRSEAGGGAVSTWSAPYVFGVGLVSSEEPAGAGEALASGVVRLYPNPARSSAAVRFRLAEPGAVSLVVYDVLGQEVARLADAAYAAGTHEAELDGSALAPGVYVVRFVSGRVATADRLTIVR
jgi:hypothetical protein